MVSRSLEGSDPAIAATNASVAGGTASAAETANSSTSPASRFCQA